MSTTTAEHDAWVNTPAQEPLPYEDLRAHQQWFPGQPVLLNTEGHEHRMFVRLSGAWFDPRWLKSGPGWLTHPCELSTRDPREVWHNAWELNLALALLAAPSDNRLAWLQELDPATEPGLCELLDLAQQELQPRSADAAIAAALGEAAPPARRGWLKSERDAMRQQAAAPPEYVNLAPGR